MTVNLLPPRRRKARRGRPSGASFRPSFETLEQRLAPANVDVLTYHNDTFLSGQNLQETALTPANVNATNFGRLFAQPVDGYVYAQPLYKANLAIPGQGTHNVMFVATEHDSIYAFDADSNTGTNANPLWRTSFINPAAGITSVPQPDIISADIVPEVGITGTPVIDGASNTLYVVAKTKEVRSDGAHYVQKLHALDITTGAEKFGGPVSIGDTTGDNNNTSPIAVPGTGQGSVNGIVTFNARKENQRSALTLASGVVYIAWASHGDNGPYHGWVVGYNAQNLQLVSFFNTSPNAGLAGIWQSGAGMAVDPLNNLYFATGNGPFDANTSGGKDYGDTVLRLSTTGALTVADYFTPWDQATLNQNDADLGSGGTMLLPDSVGSAAHRHLMVETGKSGKIYLIDRDNMGQYQRGGPMTDDVVQVMQLGPAGVWGNPCYFQVNATTGRIYYQGSGDVMKAFTVSNATLSGPVTQSGTYFAFPGSQPVISANGMANAIAWALQVDAYGRGGPAVLHAYDANNLANELYNSAQTSLRDQLTGSVKFTVPTVTNGRVIVGSQYGVAVFGLFPPATQPPAAPSGLAAQALSDTQIRLTWVNNAANATGVKIERSLDGVNFGLAAIVARDVTTFTDTGLSASTRYFYRVRATNQLGDSGYSNTADATTRIGAPVLMVSNVGSSEVDLSWTRTANDHYDVERSTDGTNFTRVNSVPIPASVTTYSDTGLARQTYYYRVHAYNVNPTDSALSNVVVAVIGPIVLDYTAGFPANPLFLTANGSAQFAETTARLTNNDQQAGSVFSNVRVGVRTFSTTFTFRIHEGTQPNPADGITFTIQGIGPTALGTNEGGLGYGNNEDVPPYGVGGIRNSVAIKFENYNHGEPGETDNDTGLFTNGIYPGAPRQPGDVNIPLPASVINLRDQHTKKVDITYSGTTLMVTITDLQHDGGPTFLTQVYTVDIPGTVGTDTAYVGFTGATGGRSFTGGLPGWSLQDVLSWRYESQDQRPGAPTNLRITSATAAGINLAWRLNAYNETGYRVERSTDGVTFTQVAQLGPNTSTYRDTAVTPGTTYHYRAYAFNGAGNSAYSNTDHVQLGTVTVDHSSGFTTHTDLTANQNYLYNPIFTAGAAQLTDGSHGSALVNYGEAGSFFLTNRVGIAAFNTSFTFQIKPGTTPMADGMTFVIQGNDPTALGDTGGGLGYGADHPGPGRGIRNSVAIKFDIFDNAGEGSDSTGLFSDGRSPTVPEPGSGDVLVRLDPSVIDLNSQHVFRVDLTYDGVSLQQTITDTTSGRFFNTSYGVDIPAKVGSNAAYLGFSGATGGLTAIQTVQTWTGNFLTEAPATHLVVSAPATSTAGTAFSVTVTALTAANLPATGYRGTVHFTSSDSQAILPSDYTFVGADNGSHTFSVTLKTAGARTVTATDTVTSSINGSASVTVNPAATSSLRVAGFPSPTTAGTAGSVTVTALDAYGNITPAYGGTVHFSSSDGQAALPVDYAFTSADNGVHTFSATLFTAGTQSITATDVANAGVAGTQGSITVTPAAASQFAVTGPAGATAGQPFSVTVTALDPYGNTATGYQGTVHFSSADPAAALPADYTFTATDAGTHTFSGVTLYTAGGQDVTANDTASNIAGTTTVSVTAASAASFLLSAPPSTPAGSPFTVTVYAVDPYGNVDTNYGGTVHFTSSDPAAALPADYMFQPSDGGVAAFTVTLFTAGDQSVTATDTVSGIMGSATVTVTTGPSMAASGSGSAPLASAALVSAPVPAGFAAVTAPVSTGPASPSRSGTATDGAGGRGSSTASERGSAPPTSGDFGPQAGSDAGALSPQLIDLLLSSWDARFAYELLKTV